MCKLQIQSISNKVFKPGTKVALSNNGDSEIRLYTLDETLSIYDSKITFHGDDLETSIEIRGYTKIFIGKFEKITVWLE
jgi:hypothetical protein